MTAQSEESKKRMRRPRVFRNGMGVNWRSAPMAIRLKAFVQLSASFGKESTALNLGIKTHGCGLLNLN